MAFHFMCLYISSVIRQRACMFPHHPRKTVLCTHGAASYGKNDLHPSLLT